MKLECANCTDEAAGVAALSDGRGGERPYCARCLGAALEEIATAERTRPGRPPAAIDPELLRSVSATIADKSQSIVATGLGVIGCDELARAVIPLIAGSLAKLIDDRAETYMDANPARIHGLADMVRKHGGLP